MLVSYMLTTPSQETKLTAKTFTGAIAVLDDFESFHTLCQKRPGYSGVATYVRKSSQYFPVAAASEVFSDADLNEEGRYVTENGVMQK